MEIPASIRSFGGFCRSDMYLRTACDRDTSLEIDVAHAIGQVLDGAPPEEAREILLQKGSVAPRALINLSACLISIDNGHCPIYKK